MLLGKGRVLLLGKGQLGHGQLGLSKGRAVTVGKDRAVRVEQG